MSLSSNVYKFDTKKNALCILKKYINIYLYFTKIANCNQTD